MFEELIRTAIVPRGPSACIAAATGGCIGARHGPGLR